MARSVSLGQLKDEPLTTLSHDRFNRGVVTLVDEDKIPKNALAQASNALLVEEGAPRPRWGVDWYGVAVEADEAIDGAAMYVTSGEEPHLIVVANGTIYRSDDDGATWDTCDDGGIGSTPISQLLTAGAKCYFEQIAGFLYIVNGVDQIARYDGTTTIQLYSSLSAPAAPTAAKTGLAATTYKYRYKVAGVNGIGFTEASAEDDIDVSLLRSSWDATNFVTLTWAHVTGTERYDIFVALGDGEFFYLDSVPANGTGTQSYVDQGQATENTNIVAPSENTTTGPRIGDITLVGSRLWGTRDGDNPWRVWWTGAGNFIGFFATGFDGGYIDLQEGSQFRPVKVEDYRDGKGTPFATVWCKSHDGRGCIWQIALETVTIDTFSFTVPSAYKLPGSRGTPAPDSVVNVLNDYIYFSDYAAYNLGSRAQFLNLLSTDEVSSDIRPNFQRVTSNTTQKVAAIYHDAKVFMSVPYGAADNTHIAVYDTEQKAWLPEAFTFGVERFIRYTDTNGLERLLCWKPGDDTLSEISDSIAGDYGVAFTTEIATGRYPVSRDRFDFMYVETAGWELSRPEGEITLELGGYQRDRGDRTLMLKTFDAPVSLFEAGWSSHLWTTALWSDTEETPEIVREVAFKKFYYVEKDINNYQFRVRSSSLDHDWILRSLQLRGTLTQGGSPLDWRL